jgi:Kef-type K+ transport system membrane component KefB
VGLEIDLTVIKRNIRLSAMVAIAGMAFPFAIGIGMAHAIYEEFIDPRIQFTHFMLFCGVAYSITAFPVLCRILTELKLLDTTVGIVVLSAGVGNDIGGSYCFLSLSRSITDYFFANSSGMGPPCAECGTCQCEDRCDGDLHPSHLPGLDTIPPLPYQNGPFLAR